MLRIVAGRLINVLHDSLAGKHRTPLVADDGSNLNSESRHRIIHEVCVLIVAARYAMDCMQLISLLK